MRRSSLGALVALVLLPACSGAGDDDDVEDAAVADAAPRDDASDAELEADGEAQADAAVDATTTSNLAPPVFLPCPTGWTEVQPRDLLEPAHCHPWPAGGPSVCPPGEAHFTGELGCRAPGAACSADPWATALPASGVLYVQPGPGSGRGTRAQPYTTIARALTAATPGSVIALAKGMYDETLVLPADITLWGACTGQVTVTRSVVSASADPTITVTGSATTLRGLTVSSSGTGILVEPTGELSLQGVVVGPVGSRGIRVTGGRLSADDLFIHDSGDADIPVGQSLRAESGAQVTARRSVFQRSWGNALDARASSITAEDIVIGAVLSIPTIGGQAPSTAFHGDGPSTITLRRALVESDSAGIGGAGRLVASDVVIRNSLYPVLLRGAASLDRIWIEGPLGAGVYAFGARATLTNVVVRGDAGERAYGMYFATDPLSDAPSIVTMAKVGVVNAFKVGIGVAVGSQLTATDLQVSGTFAESDGFAVSLSVIERSVVRVNNFRFEGSELCALQLASSATIDLADGLVVDNEIGANVQVPGYDTQRLTNRVLYSRNGVNLDSASLQIPTAPPLP